MSTVNFVSPTTTARVQRTLGGKRAVFRVMRPTLRQVQVQLRRNRRAIELTKAGSARDSQLKAQQSKIIEYLNSLHGKTR